MSGSTVSSRKKQLKFENALKCLLVKNDKADYGAFGLGGGAAGAWRRGQRSQLS